MKPAREWADWLNEQHPIGYVTEKQIADIQLDAGARPDDNEKITGEWLMGRGFTKSEGGTFWFQSGDSKYPQYPRMPLDGWDGGEWDYEMDVGCAVRLKTRRHVRLLAELLGVKLNDSPAANDRQRD